MGYRPPTTGADLDFTGTRYEGLEVRTGSVPLGMLLDIADKAAVIDQKTGPGDLRGLFSMFASVIEAWNVEDAQGRPVAPTLDGLLSQDAAFVMAIITGWIRAMSQAPPPLPASSGSGGTSPEALAAMAQMSRSLPS